MSTALDATRKKEAEREAKLRAKDVSVITELAAPTEDIVERYGLASMKMRSRDGQNQMNQAVNALRNALKHIEALTEDDA